MRPVGEAVDVTSHDEQPRRGLFHQDAVARTCELGITIGDRAYRGRGYGREPVGSLVDYAFRLRNVRKVWLTVNATNQRAIRAHAAKRLNPFGHIGRQAG